MVDDTTHHLPFYLNVFNVFFLSVFYTLKTKLFPTARVASSWTVAVPVNHIWCVLCVGVGENWFSKSQILQMTTIIQIPVLYVILSAYTNI